MKIERLNENQIRCFISNEDLVARKMKISELAYGSDKAKRLFREMMQFANKEYGFDAENIPLMIEAIPMSDNGLLLIITKVAFPDELDSRFSYFSDSDFPEQFAHGGFEYGYKGAIPASKVAPANDIIKVCSNGNLSNEMLTRHFTFKSIDDIIDAAQVIGDFYSGENDLYKDKYGEYHLILKIGNHTALEYNKTCNCLSEYGVMEFPGNKSYANILEHSKLIIAKTALNNLSKL